MGRSRQQVVWVDGMSWWRLAEDVYGDGAKWVHILAANPDVGNPAAVTPGMVLVVPVLDDPAVGL